MQLEQKRSKTKFCTFWHYDAPEWKLHPRPNTRESYYKNLCLLKPHKHVIKIQKTIHIQLLCNYPLGITTSVQLSSSKYGLLINKLHVKKLVNCIIVTSELKMSFLYGNLYTLFIYMYSTMFDFFRNCIWVTCGNYFKIVINVSLKQQLCYN